MTPMQCLESWIAARAAPEATVWFAERRAKIAATGANRDFDITFGMIPRKFGRADLHLTAQEFADAQAARQGWDPRDWSLDQAVRVLLMLAHGGTGQAFADRLQDLVQTAEIGEAIALLRGLPLYPSPELMTPIAAEGARSNMLGVFEAVAHNNPFARDHFDETQWNQMVVKAIFVGSFLAPIQGLDERANADLAVIFIDTSQERRAAGRQMSFELWRCVGPFATPDMLDEIEREVRADDPLGRQGAALAMAVAPVEGAKERLRAAAPDLADAIEAGRLTWASLSAHAAHGLQQHFERESAE